jgi:hypothetical protein
MLNPIDAMLAKERAMMSDKTFKMLFDSIFASANPQSKEQLEEFAKSCEEAIAIIMNIDDAELLKEKIEEKGTNYDA